MLSVCLAVVCVCSCTRPLAAVRKWWQYARCALVWGRTELILPNFPANALPFSSLSHSFSLSLRFFLLLFIPACPLSSSCCCFTFPLSSCPHCISLVFPFTCTFPPHFLPLPFLLLLSFLPALPSVLDSHHPTPSLPLIILLFFAAVSFNASFDTAYSLMIIRRSGDAGATHFTNPAVRASVHNHSSHSTGTEF